MSEELAASRQISWLDSSTPTLSLSKRIVERKNRVHYVCETIKETEYHTWPEASCSDRWIPPTRNHKRFTGRRPAEPDGSKKNKMGQLRNFVFCPAFLCFHRKHCTRNHIKPFKLLHCNIPHILVKMKSHFSLRIALLTHRGVLRCRLSPVSPLSTPHIPFKVNGSIQIL